MMLTFKRRFTAFFLTILMFSILSLDSPASYPEEISDFQRQRSNHTDGDGGHASGVGAFDPEVPQSPLIAGGGSQDDGARPLDHSPYPTHKTYEEEAIKPLDRVSQPPKRKPHAVRSAKPHDIFKFLGHDYKGFVIPRALDSREVDEPNEHIQSYESAMVFYDQNQAPSSQVYTWDSITTFMKETDQLFFNTARPIKSLAAGIFGALIGCVPSTPATGTLISSVGDFFHIPIGEGLSTTLVVWTTTTTTPCFAMHLGRRGYIIADSLFGEEAFPTRSGENESKPCVIKTSKLHKTAIGVLVFASSLDATVNIGVVALAYLKHFPNVFYGTGWAYFTSWGEWSYTIGRAKIDRLFCKYQYDTELSHRKRLLLLDSAQKCQQAIARKDSFVTGLYNRIFSQMNKRSLYAEENGEPNLFILSALFLQSANTMSYDAESLEEEQNENSQLLSANSRLMNFQVQQDIPLSWKEEFLDVLSTYLTGAATIGRAVSMEYILEQLLIHVVSASPPTATGIAWSASLFDLIYRSLTEGDIQKQYMQGWLKSFSLKHLGDFQWVRKITGWPAIINGGFFALAKTVAGIAGFNAWGAPLPLQILCLLPTFIQEQSKYGQFFGKGTEDIVTNIATLKQPSTNDHINVKRAWLMKWSRKIEEYLTSEWDRETIGNLYTIILKGF
jgi:hypothetical protein